MGVYHPATDSGVVHYSPPADLPAKKFWSWGVNQDARIGASRSRTTRARTSRSRLDCSVTRRPTPFLNRRRRSRSTSTGSQFATRAASFAPHPTPCSICPCGEGAATALTAAITVTRPIVQGHLRLLDHAKVVEDEAIVASPGSVLRRTYARPPCNPCTIRAARSRWRARAAHRESIRLDSRERNPHWTTTSRVSSASSVTIRVGASGGWQRRRARRPPARGVPRLHRRTRAISRQLRLAQGGGTAGGAAARADEAVAHLTKAASLVTTDAEVEYYLGERVRADSRRHTGTRVVRTCAAPVGVPRSARLELAQLDARAGNLAQAARTLDALAREAPDAIRAGVAQVAVLRHLGRLTAARQRLTAWRAQDPTSSDLALEAVLLGAADLQLWSTSPPTRIGCWKSLPTSCRWDSLTMPRRCLSSDLPAGPDVVSEPGTPRTSSNPLIAYYRGYCRRAAGGTGTQDFACGLTNADHVHLPEPCRHRSRAERGAEGEIQTTRLPPSCSARCTCLRAWSTRHSPHGRRSSRAHAAYPRTPSQRRPHRAPASTQPERAAPVLEEGLDVDPGERRPVRRARSGAQRAGASGCRTRRDAAPATPPAFDCRPASHSSWRSRWPRRASSTTPSSVFANRFFAREEGGTNVREVYLEVRRLRATDAARVRPCDEALTIADGLGDPVEGLPFTRDGLGVFLTRARAQFDLAGIFAQCGREKDAQAIWTRLSDGGNGRSAAETNYAYRSALRLCGGAGAEGCRADIDLTWMPRLQHAAAVDRASRRR